MKLNYVIILAKFLARLSKIYSAKQIFLGQLFLGEILIPQLGPNIFLALADRNFPLGKFISKNLTSSLKPNFFADFFPNALADNDSFYVIAAPYGRRDY